MNLAFAQLERRVFWLSAVLICAIAAAGAFAAWHGTDVLLQINSVLALVFCLWLVWAVLQRERYLFWRGCLIFWGFWLVFPLFKSINQFWISRRFDAELLILDRALWGGLSLPEYAMRLEHFVLSEIVSLGYALFYSVVILPVLWFTYKRKSGTARRFFLGLALMYLIGFSGYLLIPAGGPFAAFPEIFPYPPAGGVITHALVDVVAQGITGMDVFPSLHGGVSLYVLGFFVISAILQRNWAYWWASLLLLIVCIPLLAATVYLRYHYGIDLLAGTALAAAVLWFIYRPHYRLKQ